LHKRNDYGGGKMGAIIRDGLKGWEESVSWWVAVCVCGLECFVNYGIQELEHLVGGQEVYVFVVCVIVW